MKVRLVVFIIYLFSIGVCFAQVKSIPRNLRQAIKLLQMDCPDSLKTVVKKTANDKLIDLCYPWGDYTNYKTIDNWISDDNQGVKINKYLADNGIKTNQHQQTVILLAFKAKLLGGEVDEKQLFKPYQAIEAIWNKEDKVRFTTDSLRGYYIPKDLEDCFLQLNKIFTDSTKAKIKKLSENEFIGRYHLGFGTWLRNNWGLHGGSRLSIYFSNMGIKNAESMSGIIFASYYRNLKGNPIELDKQIMQDKEFWAKSDTEQLEERKLKFRQYNVGDTVQYTYPYGYVSPEQENDWMKDRCISRGIITARDTNKFFLKVRILETCAVKGIITYDTKNSYFFNAKLKKWEKFKKRKIKRSYNNDELWFNYESWYNNE